MVRMVIVGTGREHHVGVPLANPADDLNPHLEIRRQLAVMVVEHFVFDPQPAAGLNRLSPAPRRQRSAAFRLMPGVAVGNGNKLDLMPGGGVLRREATGPDVAIIRMRPEGNHSNFTVALRQGGGSGKQHNR